MLRSVKLLFASLLLLQVGNGVHATVYLAFAGLYFQDKFGLSLTQISVLVSANFLVFGVIQFVVSLFLDVGVRLAGRKWMLLRAPTVFLIGWGLQAFGTDPVVVIIGGGLVGLGGATLPLILSLLSEHTPKERNGFVAGLVSAALLFGHLLALGIGWMLIRQGFVKALFPSVCVVWGLVLVILFVTLKSDRKSESPELALSSIVAERLTQSFREMWHIFVDPATRAIKILMMITGVAPILASTYIPLHLIALLDDYTTSATYIAASTAIGYLLGMLLTPTIGAFTDRRQNQPQLLLGVLLFLAVALVVASQVHSALAISVLAAATAICSQWLAVLQNAILMTLRSSETTTTFFLSNQLPFFAGLPLGLLLAIGTIHLSGSVVNALLLVAGMFVLGAVIWARHLFTAAPKLQAVQL